MSNLTLKGVPERLHEQLRRAADANRRSLNSEVIHRLESSFGLAPLDPAELLARARAVRERAPLPYLTDAALREARERGRE